MKTILMITAMLTLTATATAATLREQQEQLENFFAASRAGYGDYWLIRRDNSGVDERIGIIFGFVDNREFCTEVARDQMKKYPLSHYDCERAN